MIKKTVPILMSLCILGSSVILPGTITKAETTKNIDNDTVVVQPRIAGMVVVTSSSGANIRSGPGTNYRKIGAANYGAELYYAYETKKDSSGVNWHLVQWGNSTGWISSQVGRLG